MSLHTQVCYFIQTHRDPEQIHRLVKTLRRGSPESWIVVEHDFAHCWLDWAPLAALPRTHLLPASGKQTRGHFSCQLQPLLDLFQWLESAGVDYEWLVTLTGQDYPVRPVEQIEAELEATSGDGFIRFWDVLSTDSPWSRGKARRRYWYQYLRLPEYTERALWALRLPTKILPLNFYLDYGPLVGVPAWRTPFQHGFRCYGGWAWFSLRRKAVHYFRDYLLAHPKLVRFYHGTVAPEESLVQTVLLNSGRFDLENDDRRYIDYSQVQRGGSPRVLTAADLPLLAAGRYHFARKFDYGVDRGVLDRVDAELLGFPAAAALA